ncbi:MAG: ATP-binding cassette domain-containing protein [Flavisolibacter sp.]
MKKILSHTWTVLSKSEKKKFCLLSVLDIVINILDIVSLALLLWLIQFYVQPAAAKNLSFLPSWFNNRDSIIFIGLFFLFFGLKNMAGFFIARSQYVFISNVAIRISQNNLYNYQHAPFEEFVQVDSSVHIRKIGFQPFEFCQYILTGIQQIITQTCLVSFTIVAIVIFDARLFLLLMAILLPPVALVFYLIKKRLSRTRSNIRSSNERSFQYLLDALKGYVEANIYHRNDFFMRRFIQARRKFSTYLFESLSLQNMPSRVIEVFAVLGLFILIVIAKFSGSQDHAAFITIGAFMAAAYKVIPGVVKLINVSGQMRAYEFSLTELLQNHSAKEKKMHTASMEISTVEFRNIHFSYPRMPVLEGFNLSLEKGDFVAITGRSGRGKTTILNLLLGFLQANSGEIIINGTEMLPEQIKKFWPSIAYVRQQSFLIHDSILKNITLEEDEHEDNALSFALKVSGVSEMAAVFPDGVQQVITENGKNISGGQQQRIGLARALYKNADLILLDEPFNELDEASVNLMLEYFHGLSKNGKIVVLITHDKQSLSYCNKIISVDPE